MKKFEWVIVKQYQQKCVYCDLCGAESPYPSGWDKNVRQYLKDFYFPSSKYKLEPNFIQYPVRFELCIDCYNNLSYGDMKVKANKRLLSCINDPFSQIEWNGSDGFLDIRLGWEKADVWRFRVRWDGEKVIK